MEAIILAGGYGKRLRASIPNLPKPMAPISGVPFLEILLNNLNSKAFSKVIISTFYKGEIISNYFGDNYKNIILEYTNEKEALGTGGAIRLASEKCNNDHYYVFNGDTFLDVNIDAMEKLWSQHNKPIMVAKKMKNCDRFGLIKIKKGFLSDFSEKEHAVNGLVNAGCYLFPKKFLNSWKYGEKFSLEKDHIKKIYFSNKIMCIEYKGIFIDIGIPNDYNFAQKLLKDAI